MMAEKDNEKGLPKSALAIIIIAVIAAVIIIVWKSKSAYQPVVAGVDAIDFILPDLNGKQVNFDSYRGKVVFLNFWATWCKPCEEEIPSMQYLYETLKGQPFEIVAVSIDKDPPESVAAFAKKYNVTFTVLHDRKGRIKELYKTTGVPETFIVDQNGVIAEKVWGPRDWSNSNSIATILELLRTGPQPKEAYKGRK